MYIQVTYSNSDPSPPCDVDAEEHLEKLPVQGISMVDVGREHVGQLGLFIFLMFHRASWSYLK